jgi:hypothetical protein
MTSAGDDFYPFEFVRLFYYTERKSFFRFLGFGKLLDSLSFLDQVLNEFVVNSSVASFAEELDKNIKEIGSLKLEETEGAKKQIELLNEKLFEKIAFVSHFKTRLSTQMQENIKNVLDNCRNSNSVYEQLQIELLELSEVKEFIRDFSRSKEKEKFISDIFHPTFNETHFQVNLAEADNCLQCEPSPGTTFANLQMLSNQALFLNLGQPEAPDCRMS